MRIGRDALAAMTPARELYVSPAIRIFVDGHRLKA
jgi:hypothetical protein